VLGACVGAAELALRVTGYRAEAFRADVNRQHPYWPPLLDGGVFEEIDDPVRRYAMRPGASVRVEDAVHDESWLFRVNRYRARGPDFPLEKPAGERRLLCLGDSFAFGLWCDEGRTLVGHLARMATEAEAARGAATRWRGISLGVPGYHSGQQLRAFEQDGLRLDPDVVVLYYNTNDIMQDGFFLDTELGVLRSDPIPLPTGLRRVLWHSDLYCFVSLKLNRYYNSIPSPHLDPRTPWAHVREDNQRATRAAIERIAELCRARGVPLFFVNQPLLTWSQDARGRNWRTLPLVDWAEELRAELGLPGIDLAGWLRGYADGVDRIRGLDADEEPPPPDFYPERYFADVAVQRYLAAVERRPDGAPEVPFEIPEEPDFHLLGAGYEHLARLCYPAMRAAGMVP